MIYNPDLTHDNVARALKAIDDWKFSAELTADWEYFEAIKPATTHYIAMAGLRGYIPNYVGSHETYDSAVDDLTELCDLPCFMPDGSDSYLSAEQIQDLRDNGYIDIDLDLFGNEYLEITECDCDDPDCHNDY